MLLRNNESDEERNDYILPNSLQEKTRRRQQIARYVYDVWTWNGAELCGLAEPILVDGRLDSLSSYVIEYYSDTANDNHDGENGRNFDSPCTTADVQQCSARSVVDTVDAADLSDNDFCDKYMYRNTPVIIRNLSNRWSCASTWVMKHPETGQLIPNLDYIQYQYGSDTISVHVQEIAGFQCPQQRPDVTNNYNMSVSDYIAWWRNHQASQLDISSTNRCDDPLLYLKDWKFVLAHGHSDMYECPQFFRDDWLNDAKDSAYKFIYLGRNGTTTALHADVLRSFSWSTNVCGAKLWYFTEPQHTHLLYDCFGTKLAYHLHADIAVTDMNLNEIEHLEQNDFMSVLYPGLRHARKYARSVLQQSGETIFVPSDWFHTVENMADTLSINHNWLNGANIRQCWQYVESKVRWSRSRTCTIGPQRRAYESELGSTCIAKSDNTGVKLDDDVHLLAEVVLRKANCYIKPSTIELSSQQKFDFLGILVVCKGVLSLYNGNGSPPKTAKLLNEVRQLQNVIETRMQENCYSRNEFQ